MRQAFELIFNNIEFFDTSNYPVQEVMRYQFNNDGALIDLQPFKSVLDQAKTWSAQMKNGEKNIIYTADWLFWTTAVEYWKETECFSSVHSHSIHINTLLELEGILNQRLEVLLECEKMQVDEDDRNDFTLSDKSNSNIFWVKDKYFYLLQALFGGYVALYGKRLDQYYREMNLGKKHYDENVGKYFPRNPKLISQLVRVMNNYNDINTHLYPYSDEVANLFLSL